jgi:hypothetical protein
MIRDFVLRNVFFHFVPMSQISECRSWPGKSPRPDGFNTDFIKKCWDMIFPDFYELCQGFYD